jgi:NADH dehydrogenase/NADH:ubiquinone oxidoreductase subunit G
MKDRIGEGLTSEIPVKINGVETHGPENMTILQAALQIGVEIPTLCYSPNLKIGRASCRERV